VFSGNPICFQNDGQNKRNLTIGVGASKIFLTSLLNSEGICFPTGFNTTFPVGTHNVYVNDNEIPSVIKVIDPSTLYNTQNSIGVNENGELKFFYNNNIELDLIYASTSDSLEGKPLSSNLRWRFTALDEGEYPFYDENSLEIYGSDTILTWVLYEAGSNQMVVNNEYLYNSKYDKRGGGSINIIDLINCKNPPNDICNNILSLHPYFNTIGRKNLILNDVDYPTIKKDFDYYEFEPGALVLPLGSELWIHNNMNKRLDIVIEKKFNPEFSSKSKIKDLIQSPLFGDFYYIGYTNSFNSFFKWYDTTLLVHLNALDLMNENYEFKEGRSLTSGFNCSISFNEPGVYRISSLTGETGSGYVVVFPNDVGNTITLKDYEYTPSFAVPLKNDFVCIKNPYDFDRDIQITGTKTNNIILPSSSEICSYDWADEKGNTLLFKDITTGGYFNLNVTSSEILNVEIMSSMFVPTEGKNPVDGTICFINNDDFNSKIEVYRVRESVFSDVRGFFEDMVLPQKVSDFDLEANSINCITNHNLFSKGLYQVKIEPNSNDLLTYNSNNMFIVIGDKNEGYIYKSNFYGSPLVITLEKLEEIYLTEIKSSVPRNIKIYNYDTNVNYHLYSKITFDDSIGFHVPINKLQTPEIIFENLGNSDLNLIIKNYNGNTEEVNVPGKSKKLYIFKENDYQVEFKESDKNKIKNSMDTPTRLKTILDSEKIIISKGQSYTVDNLPSKVFDYGPIVFNKVLDFNVSTSNTQSVYFGSSIENSDNYFVIDSEINNKDQVEIQKISGTLKNLDFAVQVLNDVPSNDILLKAKQILAYDGSLPIFMYSRLGNVEVGLDNPYKNEVINLPKGSKVSYVISEWLNEQKSSVSSSKPVKYGLNEDNVLEEDITFTVSIGDNSKKINVNALDTGKVVSMEYTPFRIEGNDDSSIKNKTYFVNNLAYEPRAVVFRPSNTNDLCIQFDGKISPITVNINNNVKKSASKMKLYDLTREGFSNLNNINVHDNLLSTFKGDEISDITIMTNYGATFDGMELKRLNSDNEIGYLYIEPSQTNTVSGIEQFVFMEGYVSGLNETGFVRAYRFYGTNDKLNLKVDSIVYSPISPAVNPYSILARAFTTNDNPTSKLLNTANVYLRMKNAKAVPNKWYMAGLESITFPQLLKAFDIYSDDKTLTEGVHAKWVDIPHGAGNKTLLVVPFSSTHIFQTFAYDVPVIVTSSNRDILTYMRTTNANYKYALQKINNSENSNIFLSNGEIINDVKMIMSENPNVANEIIGYYYNNVPFISTVDFADHYSESDFKRFKDVPCWTTTNNNNKDDSELDVLPYDKGDNKGILTEVTELFGSQTYKNVMLYTPVGMYCDYAPMLVYENNKCDELIIQRYTTEGDNLYKQIYGHEINEYCSAQQTEAEEKCMADFQNACFNGEDLCYNSAENFGGVDYQPVEPQENSPYDNPTNNNYYECYSEAKETVKECKDEINTKFDAIITCHSNVESVIVDKKCANDISPDVNPDCLNETYSTLINTDECSVSKVGIAVNNFLKEKQKIYIACAKGEYVGGYSEVTCADSYCPGITGEIGDNGYERLWWCRINIDAFGHESSMLYQTPNTDAWAYLNFTEFNSKDIIQIDNVFDTGVSFNNNIYHFISDGYWNFSKMDTSWNEKPGINNLNICADRGWKGDNDDEPDSITQFYSDIMSEGGAKIHKDLGLSEDALTNGLFFMLNSVDTSDYYFNEEYNENVVENSKGYVLSEPFTVENNNGKKLLCFGADTFNGQEVILAAGDKVNVNLDLKTQYSIYEPAYYSNLALDNERTFSHVSLFARQNIEDYKIASFEYKKPMTIDNHIINKPISDGSVNIYLYNLTTKLETKVGLETVKSDFDVIHLIEGENLIFKNTGTEPITWFYGENDICGKGFEKVLADLYNRKCEKNEFGYDNCILNTYGPEQGYSKVYSVNPYDVSNYLSYHKYKSVTVLPGATESISLNVNDLESGTTEYLFFHPESGKRLNVIVSNEKQVVNIDINTFSQDSVNLLDNDYTKLCLRNYDSVSKSIKLVPSPGTTKIVTVSSGGVECISKTELKKAEFVRDSTLNRKLKLNYKSVIQYDNNLMETLKQITNKVTENTLASYNPAYNFLELNVGAAATPSIITTEVIDYGDIIKYHSKPDFIHSVATQIFTIVSNSRIDFKGICDSDENYNNVPEGTICVLDENEEVVGESKEDLLNEFVSISNTNCNNETKFPTSEDREKCLATQKKALENIYEIFEDLNPYTVVNEDKVITMLPILIHFNNNKNELSPAEIMRVKSFISKVNEKVEELCAGGKCDNKVINSDCGLAQTDYSGVTVKNRYLDMLGFIVLIDDPGTTKKGNCSFLNNYMKGVMDISIYAATTNISNEKFGIPSLVVGFGVNRNESFNSCWSDLEFKKEIESFYTTDFTIMLDKGIIGVGHYCLRDGECKPISTGIQNGDYGLYYTDESKGWSFIPIKFKPLEPINFDKLSSSEKDNCYEIMGVPYCPEALSGSISINKIDFGNAPLNLVGFSGFSSSGISSNLINNNNNLVSAGFGGIDLDFSKGNYIGNNDFFIKNGFSFNVDIGGIVDFEIAPDLLENGIKKQPIGYEWLDRCGRYYYNGEGMTMIVYPEVEVPEGQQGKSCNPGRVMELYKKFNC